MQPFAAAIDPAIPRAALVTGGARRLGRAIALALAEAGFSVAVHCHASTEAAAATAAEIAALGVRSCVLQADLMAEAHTATLLARARAAFGPIGVLVSVDGNDVLAVYEATRDCVARARAGGGPTFLVAHTYRIEGHTVGDPLNYRPKEETALWKTPERDPLARFARRLVDDFGFTPDEVDALRQRARADIDAAIAFAKASPEPELSALWEDVYA